MAVVLATNWQITAPSPIDSRFGGSNTSPWTSIAQANTNIPSIYRYKGLTATIVSGGQAVDVWYRDGILDANLIVKQYTASLSAGQLMSLSSNLVSFIGGSITGGNIIVDISASNSWSFRGNDTATPTLTLSGTGSGYAKLYLNPASGQNSFIDTLTATTLNFQLAGTTHTTFNTSGNALFYNKLGIGSNSTDPTSRLQVVETTTSNSLVKFWDGTNTLFEQTANGLSPSFFNVPSITLTAGQILYTTSQTLNWSNVGGANTSFGQKVTITPTYPSISAVETGGFYEKQVILGSAPSSGSIYYHPYNFQTDVFDLRAQISAPSGDTYGSSTFLTMRSYAQGSAGVRDRFELRAGGSNGYTSWYTSNGVVHYSNSAMTFSIGNTATNIVPTSTTQNFSISSSGLGASVSFAGTNATNIATQKSSGNLNFTTSLWNTGTSAENKGFFSLRSVASTSASMTTNLVMIATNSATSNASAPATNSSFKFFDLKADLLNSVFAVGLALGSAESPTAKVTIGAPSNSQASLRLIGGASPSTINAGDIWFNSTSAQLNFGISTGSIGTIVFSRTSPFTNGYSIWGADPDDCSVEAKSSFRVGTISAEELFAFGSTTTIGSGYVSFQASSTDYSSVFFTPSGTEPSSTINGQMWFQDANSQFRVGTNGTTNLIVTTPQSVGFGGGCSIFGYAEDTSQVDFNSYFYNFEYAPSTPTDGFVFTTQGATIVLSLSYQRLASQGGLVVDNWYESDSDKYYPHFWLRPNGVQAVETTSERGMMWFEYTEKNFYGITANAESTSVTQVMKFLTYYDSSSSGLQTTSSPATTSVYGQNTTAGQYLGTPDLWIAINNDGTKYLIPCYQPT